MKITVKCGKCKIFMDSVHGCGDGLQMFEGVKCRKCGNEITYLASVCISFLEKFSPEIKCHCPNCDPKYEYNMRITENPEMLRA